MSAVGKTIARIETKPTNPEYDYARDDTLLIHFTDGTALCLTGHSQEDVSLYHDEMDAAAVLRWQHAAQERREAERQQRLVRAGWMALSCEERTARREARRAKRSTFARLVDDEIEGAIQDMAVSWNRMGYGTPTRVRRPCARCGEIECPNATTALA